MGKRKSKNGVKFIFVLIAVILCALTVFPMFLNVIGVTVSTEGILGSGKLDTTYLKLFDDFSNYKQYAAMQATQGLAIVALVFAALTILTLITSMFSKKVGKIALLCAVLTFLATAGSIIAVIIFCSKNSGSGTIFGQTGKLSFMPAVGMYLMWAGGLLGGLIGTVAARK